MRRQALPQPGAACPRQWERDSARSKTNPCRSAFVRSMHLYPPLSDPVVAQESAQAIVIRQLGTAGRTMPDADYDVKVRFPPDC
jgi:hypothetical protein